MGWVLSESEEFFQTQKYLNPKNLQIQKPEYDKTQFLGKVKTISQKLLKILHFEALF